MAATRLTPSKSVSGPIDGRGKQVVLTPKDIAWIKAGSTKPPTTGPTPGVVARPALPSPPVAPFLTPVQQASFNAAAAKYAQSRAGLEQQLTDAPINTHTAIQAAQQTAATDTNTTNQSTAARGLFQSSIRDSDLNDIASTLTTRTNLLNTNLATLTTGINGQIGNLDTNWGNTQGLYNANAVVNAQAVAPNVPPATPATPAVPKAPSAPAAPAAPAATTSGPQASGQQLQPITGGCALATGA